MDASQPAPSLDDGGSDSVASSAVVEVSTHPSKDGVLGCPEKMPEVGAACPCAFSCEFGDSAEVRCDTLMTGSHGQWTVSQAPATKGCESVHPSAPTPADCPSPRPRIGTSCATEDQACDYGACSGNVKLTCLAGLWEDTPVDCAL